MLRRATWGIFHAVEDLLLDFREALQLSNHQIAQASETPRSFAGALQVWMDQGMLGRHPDDDVGFKQVIGVCRAFA